MTIPLNPFLATWLYIAILWVPGFILMGYSSRWMALAKHYRLHGPAPAPCHWLISGVVGATGYRNALVIATHDDGVYVAIFPLFRPGHPPLFIPWEAVRSVHQETDNNTDTLTLIIAADQDVGITLPASMLTNALASLPPLQPDMPQLNYGWGHKAVILSIQVLGAFWIWLVVFSGWF